MNPNCVAYWHERSSAALLVSTVRKFGGRRDVQTIYIPLVILLSLIYRTETLCDLVWRQKHWLHSWKTLVPPFGLARQWRSLYMCGANAVHRYSRSSASSPFSPFGFFKVSLHRCYGFHELFCTACCDCSNPIRKLVHSVILRLIFLNTSCICKLTMHFVETGVNSCWHTVVMAVARCAFALSVFGWGTLLLKVHMAEWEMANLSINSAKSVTHVMTPFPPCSVWDVNPVPKSKRQVRNSE